MALTDLALSIMTFPQRWDPSGLTFSVLLLPTGNPRQPLVQGAPAFAGAQLDLAAVVIPELADLPMLDTADQAHFPIATQVPADAGALFDALAAKTSIVSKTPRPIAETHIKKALPTSYTSAFAFERPGSPFAVLGDEYACRTRTGKPPQAPPAAPPNEMTWGALLSFALRQPILAQKLGLLYRGLRLPRPAVSDLLAEGGWLYVATSGGAADPYAALKAQPGLVRSYAARIPALTTVPRRLFAAVLFPLVAAPSDLPNVAEYHRAELEAMAYDDGFARIVHCQQPTTANAGVGDGALAPAADAGIQLGWDDEQVVTWYNRQLDLMRQRGGAANAAPEAPLGVVGYRVDVRPDGASDWVSLTRAQGQVLVQRKFPIANAPGEFFYQDVLREPVDGEAWIEPPPVQLSDDLPDDHWLPRYFAQWRGQSLIGGDQDLCKLNGIPWQEPAVKPLAPPVQLRYGQSYSFRVRLVDLTGGGPTLDAAAINPAPAHETTCHFRRRVPPKAARVAAEWHQPPVGQGGRYLKRIQVRRPLLGYPELLYAGLGQEVVDGLVAQAEQARQGNNGKLTQVLGVPDPDVEKMRIIVEVRAPDYYSAEADAMEGPFLKVYEVERTFNAYPTDPLNLNAEAPLALDLQYRDAAHLFDLQEELRNQPLPEGAPLPIPQARDVRIRLIPVCREDPDYFGQPEERTRLGLETSLATRRNSGPEAGLWVDALPAERLCAVRLQPGGDATALAQTLGLERHGLTLSGQRGCRVVFGASAGLQHQLAPDASAITFGSAAELLRQWIVVIRLDMDRDWTWDGLAERGVEIQRDGQVVGSIRVPPGLSASVLPVRDADELRRTHLIFFDSIDPNPLGDAHPRPLAPVWQIRPSFKVAGKEYTPPGDDETISRLTLDMTLPVTAPPHQMPKIVSAGIALSPYEPADDYSSTAPRRRALWLEFAEAPKDPEDSYFCRVLAYGPDPMLGVMPAAPLVFPSLPTLPDPPDLPLTLDPELIRVITPGMSNDQAGLGAMQPMIKADGSDRHYLVPLPPGLSEDALELFGFWTYEVRVGHKEELWSTAQARYGRPLHITGLQHPAPPLACHVFRRAKAQAEPLDDGMPNPYQPPGVYVAAPYATPVLNGASLLNLRIDPVTELWFLLYAQVATADGTAHRNVLLAHRQADRPPGAWERGSGNLELKGAMQPLKTLWDELRANDQQLEDLWLRSKTREPVGNAFFPEDEIRGLLSKLGLPMDAPLSVVAVEFRWRGGDPTVDPLQGALGWQRILRASPLTPTPPPC
jgi:hypothetical protein